MIIQQYKRSTNSKNKQQHNANKLMIKIITQIFHYMIENNVQNKYINIEETFIFL